MNNAIDHLKNSTTVAKHSYNREAGWLLVEVLIGVAIFSVVAAFLLASFYSYLEYGTAGVDRLQASYLLQEGVEQSRLVRDRDWELVPEGDEGQQFRLKEQDGKWDIQELDGEEEVIEKGAAEFVRTVWVEDVCRHNESKEIVSCSEPLEPNEFLDQDTRLLTVEVEWDGLWGGSEQQASFYLHNMFSEEE